MHQPLYFQTKNKKTNPRHIGMLSNNSPTPFLGPSVNPSQVDLCLYCTINQLKASMNLSIINVLC